MMGPPAPYFCIQCGHVAPQVYKTYANGNLIKLLPCKACGELIDKYVEYDQIIVAINLVLQNSMAYRHVLLNSPFQTFWKLGIVFLFAEAYCFWCFQKGVEYEADSADFYELEVNFYRVLLRTILSTVLFHSMIFLSCIARGIVFPQSVPLQFSYFVLWKGLCLSSFTVLFQLIALIWSFSNDQSRILFADCLFVLTNTQCYFVTTGISKFKSFFIIFSAFLLRNRIVQLYDEIISI